MTTTTNIRIATINVRTLHDDIKLALAIKSTEQLKIDILALQKRAEQGQGFPHLMTHQLQDGSLYGVGTSVNVNTAWV